FVRVLEELLGHGLGVNARGHVIVAAVSQHADDFRRQNLIQYADHRFAVGLVGGRDRSPLHVLTGTPAKFLNVGYERLMNFLSRCRFHVRSLSFGMLDSSSWPAVSFNLGFTRQMFNSPKRIVS